MSISFYDAAAPIVTAESVDMSKAFGASRYERGGDDDYINCPFIAGQMLGLLLMNINAEAQLFHVWYPEGLLMPIEKLAKRA